MCGQNLVSHSVDELEPHYLAKDSAKLNAQLVALRLHNRRDYAQHCDAVV